MKTRLLTCVCLLLAAFVPATLSAAPKKKSGGAAGGNADVSCAETWNKKAKDFYGKTVKTFVLDVGSAGTVTSAAPAAVVPVDTGDKNKNSGGRVLVLMPPTEFSAFGAKFSPDADESDSAFGGKIEYKLLSAVFAEVGGENVLLFKIKADALKDFVPSEALDKQRGGADDGKSSREGFAKKVFRVSKMGKKPSAEFKRLVALYNQGKSKTERMKEKEVLDACESDEEFSLSAFDEKAKVEWVIRQ